MSRQWQMLCFLVNSLTVALIKQPDHQIIHTTGKGRERTGTRRLCLFLS